MSTKTAAKIVLTSEECISIKDKLENLKSQLYKTDFNLNEYLDKNFDEDQKAFVSEDIKDGESPSASEKSIDELIKNLSSLDDMHIKIPFNPSISFKNWIKEFLIEKTNKDSKGLIINIETDESLLAGVYIQYKGKIHSKTIKNEILNIFSFK